MNTIYHGHRRLMLFYYLILALVLIISIISCSPQQPASPPAQPGPSSSQPASPATQDITPSPSTSGNGIDAVNSENEYPNMTTYDGGNYELYWAVEDGGYVKILMKAKTSGFVAVGIQPDITMQHADLIIGYVKDGKTTVMDAYSVDAFGPHSEDTALGGTDDVKQYAGIEKDGYTTIEFRRKFDTGDDYDNPVSKGVNKIIWSYGSDDDIAKKHATRGYGEIGL